MTAGRTALLNDDVGVSKILPNDLQVLRASLRSPFTFRRFWVSRREARLRRATRAAPLKYKGLSVRPADANAMHRNEFGKVLHPKTKMNE